MNKILFAHLFAKCLLISKLKEANKICTCYIYNSLIYIYSCYIYINCSESSERVVYCY